jgi:O-antigen/teichoic acid export membrane protein
MVGEQSSAGSAGPDPGGGAEAAPQAGRRGIIGRALKRPFVRGVMAVSGAAVISQVITVVVAPITSRQYGPEAYGVLGVFLSLTGMIASLAGLMYPQAIALPREDDDALALLGLVVRIAFAAALAVAVVLLVFHGWVADLTGLPESRSMLVAAAATVLFAGLSAGLGQWLVRKKAFKRLGALSVGQSAAVNGSRGVLGAIVPSATALIAVSVVGAAFGTLLVWLGARRSLRHALGARAAAPAGAPTPAERRRAVARRYRDFPLYREPQQLLNTASANLPLLLLAAWYGSTVAGWWGLCLNVLTLPFLLIGDPLAKVYLPHAAEEARSGQPVRPLLVRSTLTLVVVGGVAFGIIFAFGPWLFSTIFGAEWATAGQYARWMALASLPAFAHIPSVQTIPLLGLQGRFLAFEIVVTVLRVAAIVLGAVVVGEALASVILYAVVGVVANLSLMGYVLRESGARRRAAY